MKSIFNYLLDVHDDFGMSTTFPKEYKVVNVNDFDIKPKKDYLKRRIADREEDKRRLESARNNTLQYYDNKILEVQTEIERLKRET